MRPIDTPPALRGLALVVAAGLAGTALFVRVLQPAWHWATHEAQTAVVLPHPASKSEGPIFTFDPFWLLPTGVLSACMPSSGLAHRAHLWRARREL